jgi:hypothetical protein
MIEGLRAPAMALIAAGSLVLGANAASAASGHATFKTTFSGSAQLTSETTASFVGAGSATRMGRITNDGQVVVTGPSDMCSGGLANINTETLTNNDGDTVTITSDEVACPTGPGQYHGTGQWTVTGGTGRFSGATGQGSLDGDSDFSAGTFSITLIGTLVVPGA